MTDQNQSSLSTLPAVEEKAGADDTLDGLLDSFSIRPALLIGIGAFASLCVGLAIFRSALGQGEVGILMALAAAIIALPYIIPRIAKIRYGKFVAEFRRELNQVAQTAQAAKEVSKTALESAQSAKISVGKTSQALQWSLEEKAEKEETAPEPVETGGAGEVRPCPNANELRALFESKYSRYTGDEEDDPLKNQGLYGKDTYKKYGIDVRVREVEKGEYSITISAKSEDTKLMGDRVYLLVHPTYPKRWWHRKVRNGSVEFSDIHAWDCFTCLLYFCPTREFVEINLCDEQHYQDS
ncbi:MAG: hypothetical protein ICCCNLDF_03581 [Planctomycetes bacterium]|nr:hypothetical protein [Planctomycetota bacterium]